MEPFSLLGFVVISMAAGAMLTIVSKKPNSPVGKTDNAPVITTTPEPTQNIPKVQKENAGVIDAEKEQAIEELIALHD